VLQAANSSHKQQHSMNAARINRPDTGLSSYANKFRPNHPNPKINEASPVQPMLAFSAYFHTLLALHTSPRSGLCAGAR